MISYLWVINEKMWISYSPPTIPIKPFPSHETSLTHGTHGNSQSNLVSNVRMLDHDALLGVEKLDGEVLRVVSDVGAQRGASGLVHRRAGVSDQPVDTQNSLYRRDQEDRTSIFRRRRHSPEIRPCRQVSRHFVLCMCSSAAECCQHSPPNYTCTDIVLILETLILAGLVITI